MLIFFENHKNFENILAQKLDFLVFENVEIFINMSKIRILMFLFLKIASKT